MTDIVNYKKKYLKYKRKYLELSQKGGICSFTFTNDGQINCLSKQVLKFLQLLQDKNKGKQIKIEDKDIEKNISIIEQILTILKKDKEKNEKYATSIRGVNTNTLVSELNLVEQRIAKYNVDIKLYTNIIEMLKK